jgi:hypothetical protein
MRSDTQSCIVEAVPAPMMRAHTAISRVVMTARVAFATGALPGPVYGVGVWSVHPDHRPVENVDTWAEAMIPDIVAGVPLVLEDGTAVLVPGRVLIATSEVIDPVTGAVWDVVDDITGVQMAAAWDNAELRHAEQSAAAFLDGDPVPEPDMSEYTDWFLYDRFVPVSPLQAGVVQALIVEAADVVLS